MRTDVTASGHEVQTLRRLLAAQQALADVIADLPPTGELLRRLLSTVGESLGWSFGAVWQLDREAELLLCAAIYDGSGRPEVRAFGEASLAQAFARGRGLPGQAWASGRAEWLPELVWDPRMPSVEGATRAGLRSAVALPLGTNDAFQGVLELFADEVRAPDHELTAGLAVLAAQVAQYLARWRTHETLVQRERALAAAQNGVVIADATRPGFPILYVNPGFERLTGYAAGEVVGRPCSLLQGPDTDAAAVAEFRAALGAGRDARVTVLNYRRDGTPFWNEVHLSPVVDDAGALVQYIGVQSDVTQRRAAEEQAHHLAYHDPLTGLANRALLAQVLDRTVARAQRDGTAAALLFVDLDGFKAVNDACGHAAGDALLRTVAERLRAVVRAGDLLARQGGDEFLLVLGDLPPAAAEAHARDTAERVRAALAAPVAIDGQRFAVRGSVGVSVLGRDAGGVDALLRHADAAMYRAKRTGGGVRLYEPTGRQGVAGAGRAPRHDDAAPAPARAGALAHLLGGEGPGSVYQPIVELETGAVVAYEALARGPLGSLLERPDRLFRTAREAGRLAELDWACRAAAVRGALNAGLERSQKLFVNMEPTALGVPCPAALAPLWARASEELDLVLEITERALTARPADLLHLVAAVRRRGWGIALDDVGADMRSLALMPLLRPEVIKLDLRLVQRRPTTDAAAIVNAVGAEHERTGAIVLAEGIETEEHLATARAMGATLGQGGWLGRPGPLAPGPAPARPLRLPAPTPGPTAPTPYEVVREVRAVRRADKRLLLALSLQLEAQAASLGESAVIASAFQDAERFTPATRRRYSRLGAHAAFVAALGVGMEAEPAPRVRGAALDPADPLLGEWSVAVLGPHFAAALVAVDLGDAGPELERRFDFALTYDRDLVVAAVASLVRRVRPLGRSA